METHLKIIGILLMILAFIHLVFPKYFKWEEELIKLSLINQQILKVHTFFIALVVFLMGLLCYSEAQDLVSTPLGKTITIGLSIFWTIRMYFQFFVYSKALWQGKTFETAVHILFSLFWIYLTLIFVWISLSHT